MIWCIEFIHRGLRLIYRGYINSENLNPCMLYMVPDAYNYDLSIYGAQEETLGLRYS